MVSVVDRVFAFLFGGGKASFIVILVWNERICSNTIIWQFSCRYASIVGGHRFKKKFGLIFTFILILVKMFSWFSTNHLLTFQKISLTCNYHIPKNSKIFFLSHSQSRLFLYIYFSLLIFFCPIRILYTQTLVHFVSDL